MYFFLFIFQMSFKKILNFTKMCVSCFSGLIFSRRSGLPDVDSHKGTQVNEKFYFEKQNWN